MRQHLYLADRRTQERMNLASCITIFSNIGDRPLAGAAASRACLTVPPFAILWVASLSSSSSPVIAACRGGCGLRFALALNKLFGSIVGLAVAFAMEGFGLATGAPKEEPGGEAAEDPDGEGVRAGAAEVD